MTNSLRRMSAGLSAVVGATAFAAMAVPTPAMAADTCDPGEYCVYQGSTVVYSSTTADGADLGHFDSNGYVKNRGSDNLEFTVELSGGADYTACLQAAGQGQTTWGFPAGSELKNVRWAGGC
ncbi:hypothetical protein [Salininema proteolyticum]|uniref:Peptidase inhibitor family I36 n=1 Tax=Salininema proteolyticum TaxID=1607685 RepID=A0ABV8TSD3_9ACTN